MDTLGEKMYQDFQGFVSDVNALENPHWELPNGTEVRDGFQSQRIEN